MIQTIKEKILDMCRMSSLVYFGKEEMALRYNQHNIRVLQKCKEIPKLIDNTEDYNDGQAFMTVYNNEGLLVFRGSETIRDWMSDFNVIRVKMDVKNLSEREKPLVHYGFIRQYRSLEDQIHDELNDYIDNHNITTLNIAGHSLGGALASIASIQLHHEFPNLNICCYTFGSPRPGDKEFSKLFLQSVNESYRFLNAYDPVTATPTTWRFCHVDAGKWIYDTSIENENRTTHFNRFWCLFRHGIMSFLGWTQDSLASFHSIDKYYEDIKNKWKDE